MHTQSMQQTQVHPATVICLHSSASNGGQWAALRTQLEPGIRALTPDLYGHGAGPAWHGFDEDIVAADAARIGRLAATIPGNVHLVGHSYGGVLALRVALYHPENVASVAVYEPVAFRVLFDYDGRRRPASEIIEVASEMRRRLRSRDAPGAAARFIDYWGGGGTWQRLSADQQDNIAMRIATVAAHFAALAKDAVRLADYRCLRAPVLMLAGSETRAPARRVGELLRFALPSAASCTMAGMGHMGPITHANVVAQRIAAFVRECAFRAESAPRELAA